MKNSPLSADDCRLFEAHDQWFCYVPITKVYSTYLRRALPAAEFDIHSWQWHKISGSVPDRNSVQYLVALRDPVERWVSGIVEHWCRAQPDRDWSMTDNYDWLFDQIEFDVHTLPQIQFLDLVPMDRCVWLWAPATGIQCHTWWHDHDVDLRPVLDADRNLGNARPQIWFDHGSRLAHPIPGAVPSVPSWQIQHTVRWLLDQDSSRVARVRDHYRDDYTIINSVKFYGSCQPAIPRDQQ